MHVHHPLEDDEKYRDLICKKSLISESPLLDPANGLKYLRGQDKVLKFVKTGSVSAAEYACWHRIVQEQLRCNKSSNHTMEADFELATICFHKIGRVHRFSEGSHLGRLG